MNKIEQRWQYVMTCLSTAFAEYNATHKGAAYSVGEDEQGMRDASAHDLIEWVADMEARLCVDVDDVRGAMFDYVDERDSETARAIVAEAFGDASKVVGHDPRGVFVAGAEVEQPRGEYCPIGFYMYDDGTWVIATYDDDGAHDAMCDGRGNFDRAQVIALLREKFAKAGAA